jgi:hypothetical protein
VLFADGKLLVATALTLLGVVGAPNVPEASQRFDGQWSVRAFPNAAGGCDGIYQLPVKVTAGSVTYVGRGAIEAEGGIQANGSVEVSFYSEGDRLDARGMMRSPRTGRGTWKSYADGCSGTWIAHRT